MIYLFTGFHIFLALVVIGAVLAQSGKGADIASVFGGGGGSSAFGPTGAANILWKVTAAAFALFIITSTILSIIQTKRDMPTPLKAIEKRLPATPRPPIR